MPVLVRLLPIGANAQKEPLVHRSSRSVASRAKIKLVRLDGLLESVRWSRQGPRVALTVVLSILGSDPGGRDGGPSALGASATPLLNKGTSFMAEQFILPNATSKLLKNFLKTVKCSVTSLAHADVGWNSNSRKAYNGLMGLQSEKPPQNRTGLPPHFYIEIPAKTKIPTLSAETDLVRALSRGKAPSLLKALDKASQKLWDEGRNFEALNAELQKGNVSVCIYHLDGVEVGNTEQAKVDGFPKK